jgi:hypothetical protein
MEPKRLACRAAFLRKKSGCFIPQESADRDYRGRTMTRSILAAAFSLGAVMLLSMQGCKQSGVGDPCIPELEYDPNFNAFTLGDVYLESKSFQCQTRLCLVNHFRGRLTCPYGQNMAGGPPAGGDKVCALPNQNCDPATKSGCIVGRNGNAEVPAQCSNHRADKSVYCSCRCANELNKTDDGANYCSCPDGYACKQLVAPTKLGNEGLTGAYCVKADDTFDPLTSGCEPCDPALANCNPPK